MAQVGHRHRFSTRVPCYAGRESAWPALEFSSAWRCSRSLFFDAHFGAGSQGGFAYRFALLPFGVALYDRHQTISLEITTGLQLQGVTDHQLLGVQMPVRAYARLRMDSHFLLDLWASDDTSLSRPRDDGSAHALFGDELRAGLSLRIGSGGELDEGRHRVLYGNGYFVGVRYAERFQTEKGAAHAENLTCMLL